MEDFIFDLNYSTIPSPEVCMVIGSARLPFDDFMDLDLVKKPSFMQYCINPLNILARNYDNYLKSIRLSTSIESEIHFLKYANTYLDRITHEPSHLSHKLKLGAGNEFGCVKGTVVGKQVIYYMQEAYRHTDYPNLTLMSDRVILCDTIEDKIAVTCLRTYIQDKDGLLDLNAEFQKHITDNKLTIEQALWLFDYNIRLTEYS